jgi:drug/metabolite transporter (DMT)-like permease
MALIGLLELVLGPLWAWLGAGEAPARATLVGGSIVLAALVLNELAAFSVMARRNSARRYSASAISKSGR